MSFYKILVASFFVFGLTFIEGEEERGLFESTRSFNVESAALEQPLKMNSEEAKALHSLAYAKCLEFKSTFTQKMSVLGSDLRITKDCQLSGANDFRPLAPAGQALNPLRKKFWEDSEKNQERWYYTAKAEFSFVVN